MNAEQKTSQDDKSDLFADWSIFNIQSVANESLDSLLTDVLMHNTDAFEQLHATLYPLMFNYAKLFLINEEKIDQLLVDEFLYCWYNRQSISNDQIKITLIKGVRYRIAVILKIETGKNTLSPITGGMLSNPIFQNLENDFLKEFMALSEIEIEQLNKIKVL
jgi:hypothetical protein